MTWFDYETNLARRERGYANEDMLFAVEFALNKDVQHYSRSIYTFLDVLGDIGGLLDSLRVVA